MSEKMTSVEELFGIFLLLLGGRVTAATPVRLCGVCCVFISDPEEAEDFLQHEVDDLLLVRGLRTVREQR